MCEGIHAARNTVSFHTKVLSLSFQWKLFLLDCCGFYPARRTMKHNTRKPENRNILISTVSVQEKLSSLQQSNYRQIDNEPE